MGLESATYINQLNASNPLGIDGRNTTDDHIRLIKSTLLSTFAGITGQVTATQAEINALNGSGITLAKLTALMALSGVSQGALTPVGGIIMWSGSIASLSALAPYWYLCNGSNGTPNLVDKFIICAGVDSAGISNTQVTGANTKSGGTKDAIVVDHGHTATSTVNDPGHAHGITSFGGGSGGSSVFAGSTFASVPSATNAAATGISVNTSIANAGSSGTNANLPPYYALAFIMRAS